MATNGAREETGADLHKVGEALAQLRVFWVRLFFLQFYPTPPNVFSRRATVEEQRGKSKGWKCWRKLVGKA